MYITVAYIKLHLYVFSFVLMGYLWDLLWVSKTPIESFQELRTPILHSHQNTWEVAGPDFVLQCSASGDGFSLQNAMVLFSA